MTTTTPPTCARKSSDRDPAGSCASPGTALPDLVDGAAERAHPELGAGRAHDGALDGDPGVRDDAPAGGQILPHAVALARGADHDVGGAVDQLVEREEAGGVGLRPAREAEERWEREQRKPAGRLGDEDDVDRVARLLEIELARPAQRRGAFIHGLVAKATVVERWSQFKDPEFVP